MNAFLTIALLTLFVVLHELGHYISAKRSKIAVSEFFVGFGPRLFSFKRNNTEYGLKALLLGGYTGTAYIRTNEEWNGVNWVEVADMSASGGFGVAGVAADSTSALAFGGAPPVSVATEEWSSTSNTTKTIDQD